ASNLLSEHQRTWDAAPQLDERNNRGCGRVNIGGIKMIGKILGPTVDQEKSFSPEFIAMTDSIVELIVCTCVDDAREAGQNVRGVKIVRPRLMRVGAIRPRAILLLPAHDVKRRAVGPIDQTLLSE